MKISFCTTCKGRTHHLRQTLLANLRHNVDWNRPDDVEFVVLDYSSDDGLVEWLTSDPQLQPYRAAGILKIASAPGQTHFRHSHAKNMAHFLATGDYVCNLDADNFTGPGFAQYLRSVFKVWPWAIVATDRLDKRLNAGLYKGSMGRVALSYGSFAMLGGYDESDRFRGWAGEDSDLVIRAVRYRMRPVFIRNRRYLRVVLHSDLERIVHTEHTDASAELAKISALDGSHMRPILKYLLNRAVAPRVANRGTQPGAGEIVWHDVATPWWEVEAVG
ncbi:glycosyltransferase family 2 protein [Enemella sp. A6]|uniref:glycosyltransferase family 2 protein n=1 Tax=Enemella sp. A6 TaxID=3440152 RepID=UPI003EB8BA06